MAMKKTSVVHDIWGDWVTSCRDIYLWNEHIMVLLRLMFSNDAKIHTTSIYYNKSNFQIVTNFIWSYLRQFFDDSHGLKASLKPLKRPFDRCQSCLKAINNGRDIKQINW